jgi:hypothetical protein
LVKFQLQVRALLVKTVIALLVRLPPLVPFADLDLLLALQTIVFNAWPHAVNVTLPRFLTVWLVEMAFNWSIANVRLARAIVIRVLVESAVHAGMVIDSLHLELAQNSASSHVLVALILTQHLVLAVQVNTLYQEEGV